MLLSLVGRYFSFTYFTIELEGYRGYLRSWHTHNNLQNIKESTYCRLSEYKFNVSEANVYVYNYKIHRFKTFSYNLQFEKIFIYQNTKTKK